MTEPPLSIPSAQTIYWSSFAAILAIQSKLTQRSAERSVVTSRMKWCWAPKVQQGHCYGLDPTFNGYIQRLPHQRNLLAF